VLIVLVIEMELMMKPSRSSEREAANNKSVSSEPKKKEKKKKSYLHRVLQKNLQQVPRKSRECMYLSQVFFISVKKEASER
jgi:hypothetical protein